MCGSPLFYSYPYFIFSRLKFCEKNSENSETSVTCFFFCEIHVDNTTKQVFSCIFFIFNSIVCLFLLLLHWKRFMVTVFLRLGIVKIEKRRGYCHFCLKMQNLQERVIVDTSGGLDYETMLVKGDSISSEGIRETSTYRSRQLLNHLCKLFIGERSECGSPDIPKRTETEVECHGDFITGGFADSHVVIFSHDCVEPYQLAAHGFPSFDAFFNSPGCILNVLNSLICKFHQGNVGWHDCIFF